MKIGIITFHNAYNYGAVLQCYALQEFLLQQGYDVQVIDYRNKYLLSCYKVWDVHRIVSKNPIIFLKKSIKECLFLKHRKRRGNKFDNFINNKLRLSNFTKENLRLFDLIIIGSDQVWNVHLTNGFDPVYWGNFEIKENGHIISYAASIEEYWDLSHNEKAISLLNKFSSISVREYKTAMFLHSLLNRHIYEVVDPTLLVNAGFWNTIAVKPKIKQKYLLLYQVRNSKITEKYARRKAKELGLKLICLSARVNVYNSKECIDASPTEYLGWFKYASFIICTSFHGTVFSIVYKIPFISIKLDDGRNSRVETLLQKVGLEGRFLSPLSIAPPSPINWQSAYDALSYMRNLSAKFLLDNIK